MLVISAIIFVLSLLIITSMFLVKYAQSGQRGVRIRIAGANQPHESLWPYFKKKFRAAANVVWHFILEAKDLKPATTKTLHTQVEKVKSVFRIRIRSSETDPQWLPEAAELSVNPINQNPEDLYLQAIKRNPNDRSAYEALGRLYLQNKNYQDAAETYQFLCRLDPTKDIYYSNLGLSFYSLREYKKAISAYEKALSINNKIPTRWINLSLCYEALEDYTKTVKAIIQALGLDKLNINYMMMLADAYAQIPNKIRAEEVLEQILSLEPTNKVAREKLMKLKI